MNSRVKIILPYLIFFLAIPSVLFLGVTVFSDREYAFIALSIAILACVPFFVSFEKNKNSGKLLIIIAVMIAISSIGRFVFAAIPHFKPVTALVVITAIHLGPRVGFVTGAMTAIVSNMYFGQGPWTPFQMFSWGIVGLIAGLIAPLIRERKTIPMILLSIYGVISGVLYSLLMDTWVTIWWDGTFNLTRYIANITTAVPVTITYMISNVVFLLVFTFPIGGILERIKYKYGIGKIEK